MSMLGPKPDYDTLPRLNFSQARAAAADLLEMEGRGAPVDDGLQLRIERFYNCEARLLDAERYHDWYAMLADDLFYWMPILENRFRRDKRPLLSPDHMAMFDESKVDIAIRLGRLDSNMVWTEDPPTRHVYIVSNVEAYESDVKGEYEVHTTFIQYRNRVEHDDSTIYGRRRDRIRAVGDGFQIVRRLILVPHSVLLTKNLSVFF